MTDTPDAIDFTIAENISYDEEMQALAEASRRWLAETISDALRAAREDGRRQGAQEMRETAAIEARDPALFQNYVAGPLSLAGGIASAIRALPLPGDAPAQEETT